ncbi:DoxX family membrane protein [Vibrio sp. OCN044]|uniref:DoxX family membrane protein n=1 Tax=Vibrio tetraodonis subsp. pristinus TaxID=2695891 RepID=A0A6L8M5K0_9VIBR|nr:DoxX family protein [Vibrio tetraodonis]MYM61272.1 DoxX family membrane protein [Vibrio tetraodonis subsp. pristinus]
MPESINNLIKRYDTIVDKAQCFFVPLLLLFCRLWVAWVFFNSGLVKISSWDSTLYLFEYEYQVPILPWELAAYMGTAAELILPVFLALGLLSRLMGGILFVFNIIAVVSYPLLWEKGFYDHQLWGLMILIVVVWGPGPLSADKLIKGKSQS